MNATELEKLAKKYLNNTASQEEKDALNRWYDTIHNDIAEEVNTKKPETAEEVKYRILNSLQQKAFVKIPYSSTGFNKKQESGWHLHPLAAAAAILFLIFLIWPHTTPQQTAPGKQLVSAPKPKVIRIILSDGSTVWLNAGTVFRYPKKFNSKLRKVELLEGHAYFEIKHHSKQPFVVKTSSLNVTVLGTSFDVRAYRDEETTRVSVVSGKVGVTLSGNIKQPAIMLLPRQQVVLSKISQHISKQAVEEISVNTWCSSQLVFEQERLSNVFKALETKYHTKIEVNDNKLLNERISITLSNQHLDTVMEILSFTKHFKYEIANDSTVVIK